MGDLDTDPPADSVDPQNNTSGERGNPPPNVGLPPEIQPTVKHKRETTYCKPDQTPLWKIVLEVGAVAVGIVVALIYYGQLSVTRGQLGEIIKQYPEIKKAAEAGTTAAEAATNSAKTAREAFIATNRPFVGVDTTIGNKDIERHSLSVTVAIKNFGTTPAYEFSPRWDLYLNGIKQRADDRIPDKPSILFPGQFVALTGTFVKPTYDALEARTMILVIYVTVSYAGPVENYHTCQKYRYAPQYAPSDNPRAGLFIGLGAC
jgi:hypothetical protein